MSNVTHRNITGQIVPKLRSGMEDQATIENDSSTGADRIIQKASRPFQVSSTCNNKNILNLSMAMY